jgi:hypothetical protein
VTPPAAATQLHDSLPLSLAQETAELKTWYEAGGAAAPTTEAGEGLANSRMMGGGKSSGAVASLAEIQPEELAAVGEPPSFHDVRVTLNMFTDTSQRDIWYKACPQAGCNKKVRRPTAMGKSRVVILGFGAW